MSKKEKYVDPDGWDRCPNCHYYDPGTSSQPDNCRNCYMPSPRLRPDQYEN